MTVEAESHAASEPTVCPVSPVVIIGAGLVGASVGMALTKAGVEVHLLDRVKSHAVVAAGLGAGEFTPIDPALVRTVVVAVPPDAATKVIRASLTKYPNAVVTDVASVKQRLHDRLADDGVEVSRYVGSHPMAGSQHSGPLTAVAELFVNRTWVITEDAENPQWAVDRVQHLAELCGARVVHMASDQHDEAVAQVSHVPQVMSSLTAARLREIPAEHLTLAGQGVRDVTRIAASDPVLWRQIITANAPAIRRELEAIRADLDQLLADLDTPEQVEQFIDRGRQGAHALPGKHGGAVQTYESVVVQIPDAPGALARLFADIDAAGVNVEDLSIEHDATREVGYLSIAVSVVQAPALRAAMRDAGWSLRA